MAALYSISMQISSGFLLLNSGPSVDTLDCFGLGQEFSLVALAECLPQQSSHLFRDKQHLTSDMTRKYVSALSNFHGDRKCLLAWKSEKAAQKSCALHFATGSDNEDAQSQTGSQFHVGTFTQETHTCSFQWKIVSNWFRFLRHVRTTWVNYVTTGFPVAWIQLVVPAWISHWLGPEIEAK